MHFFSFFLVLTSIVGFEQLASAQGESSISYVGQEPGAQTALELRRARRGLAVSGLGIALSSVGIILGGVTQFYGVSCSAISSSNCNERLAALERRARVGGAIAIVSLAGLGASIFGVVRTRKQLEATRRSRKYRGARLARFASPPSFQFW